MRKKTAELEAALTGRFTTHHRFLLMQALMQLDFLDEEIAAFTAEIEQRVAAQSETEPAASPVTYARAIELWDSIPGIKERNGQVLAAEIGVDMSRFPTAEQLASWCGVCPGNDESAGKQRSGRMAPGDRPVRKALVQAAWAASHTKNSYLQTLYHRIAARRGKKRAIIAVAHSILISGWHMLTRNEPYRESGAATLTEKQTAKAVKRTVKKLKSLGYEVELKPLVSAVSMESGERPSKPGAHQLKS